MLNNIINISIKKVDDTLKYMIKNRDNLGKKYYIYYFKIKEYKKLLDSRLENINKLNDDEKKQLSNLILDLNTKLTIININIKDKNKENLT